MDGKCTIAVLSLITANAKKLPNGQLLFGTR